MFTWVDFLILIILVISMIHGGHRGFVREILGLAVWVVSFWVALTYTPLVTSKTTYLIAHPVLHFYLSFLAIFILSFILCCVIVRLFSSLVDKSDLSHLNHIFGAIFALIRIILIILIVLIVIRIFQQNVPIWWQKSYLVPKIWSVFQLIQAHWPNLIPQFK